MTRPSCTSEQHAVGCSRGSVGEREAKSLTVGALTISSRQGCKVAFYRSALAQTASKNHLSVDASLQRGGLKGLFALLDG